METKSVESIVDTLRKYRSNPVSNSFFIILKIQISKCNIPQSNLQIDLLTIALQGNTCAKNRLNFRRIVETALGATEAESSSKNDDVAKDPQTIEIVFTDNQLNEVVAELNKYLTPENVQRARKIFRGFQSDASPEELEAGSVGGKAE